MGSRGALKAKLRTKVDLAARWANHLGNQGLGAVSTEFKQVSSDWKMGDCLLHCHHLSKLQGPASS